MPPGFRPLAFCEDPAAFGRSPARWKPVPDHLRAVAAAARLQHRLARRLREAFGEGVVAAVAAALGRPERADYLRRKLNGQVPLTLVELCEWVGAFPWLAEELARPDGD